MPEMVVTFEVFCGECGAGICDHTESRSSRSWRDMPSISVKPCEKCMAKVRQEGYDEGYENALAVDADETDGS